MMPTFATLLMALEVDIEELTECRHWVTDWVATTVAVEQFVPVDVGTISLMLVK